MNGFQNGDGEKKPIRLGIVGAGNWANRGHLRVLSVLNKFQVVAIYARRKEAAIATANEFHITHVCETIQELVTLVEIDLIVVLNTAPQHAETVRAVITAGKHVYCEWPLTTNSETAEELLQLARQANVRHFVGLQRRLAIHNRYAHDLIADGYVGAIRSVRMHVSMNYFQAVRPKALAWTAPPENFSSVVAIYAGHFLDMLFAAIGRPIELSGLLVNQFPIITIAETDEVIATTAPDQLVLSARLESTAVISVHIEGGKRNGSGVQIDITGDVGDLRITNVSAFGSADYVVEGASGDNQPFMNLEVPASYTWLPGSDLPASIVELGNLYVALARDLVEGTSTAPTFEDAVWMHRLLETVETSSAKGMRVSLNERRT
jgi:predicted dehydrogenase